MMTLIKKDFRFYRTPMKWLLIGILLVNIVGPLIASFGTQYQSNIWSMRFVSNSFMASCIGIWLMPVFVTLLAAISYSLERRDNWAGFTAMLPVPRWKIACSKLLVAIFLSTVSILVVLLFQGFIFVIGDGLDSYLRLHEGGSNRVFGSLFNNIDNLFLSDIGHSQIQILYIVSFIHLFGLAWLCSSLLRSPSLAFGIPFLIIMVEFIWLYSRQYEPFYREIFLFFLLYQLCIGALTIILGTVIQSVRTSP